jgi:hypothetical protein
MDGTLFELDRDTQRLHYPGDFEEIPKGDNRITLFSPAPGPPAGFQWAMVQKMKGMKEHTVWSGGKSVPRC